MASVFGKESLFEFEGRPGGQRCFALRLHALRIIRMKTGAQPRSRDRLFDFVQRRATIVKHRLIRLEHGTVAIEDQHTLRHEVDQLP